MKTINPLWGLYGRRGFNPSWSCLPAPAFFRRFCCNHRRNCKQNIVHPAKTAVKRLSIPQAPPALQALLYFAQFFIALLLQLRARFLGLRLRKLNLNDVYTLPGCSLLLLTLLQAKASFKFNLRRRIVPKNLRAVAK